MISLLRRKPRTTVPLKRAAIAFNAVLLVAAVAGTAFAQYPVRTYPLPGPQMGPAPQSAPSTGGQVMYFCKPADASVPLSGSSVVPAGDPGSPSPGPQNVPAQVPQTPVAGPAQMNVGTPTPTPQQTTPNWTQPGLTYTPAANVPSPPSQAWVPPASYGNQGAGMTPAPTGGIGAYASQPVPIAAPGVNPVPPPTAFAPISQPAPALQPGTPLDIPRAMPSTTVPQPSPGYNPPAYPLPDPQSATGQPDVQPRQMIPPDPRPLSPEYSTVLPNREQILQMRDPRVVEEWVIAGARARLSTQPVDKKFKVLERFPEEEKIGAGLKYQAKTSQYPPQTVAYQNYFLVHRRLHFEEMNAERYGWDLGLIQPFVSSAYFFKDVLFFPYSLASGFTQGFWDSSAGKCMPGSPTPYMLYPPGLSITGGAFEGVVATGLAFIIPIP